MTGLIIDNFAGGGGASTGIEAALGRAIDVAINHDEAAIAVHQANHPSTKHYCQSIYSVDPYDATEGKPVMLAWFSPDCKHHSKAKGGKPRDKNIRDMAWVVPHWIERLKLKTPAGAGAPEVIMLENVEEFRKWGPLDKKGRPIKERAGEEFELWVRRIKKHGYKVEHKELKACDYGTPTSRKRLFLIARRDNQPIVWPKPTHGDPESDAVRTGALLPWRTAAECIDWSIPCPSVFDRKIPLKDTTCKRIAAGVMKYVINSAKPFIIPLTHAGGESRVYSPDAPLPTVTGANRGEMAAVSPGIVPITHTKSGNMVNSIERPLRTVTTAKGGELATTTASLIKLRNNSFGEDPAAPLGAVTASGLHHGIASATLIRHFGKSKAADITKPMPTVVAGGGGKTAVLSAFIAQHNTERGGRSNPGNAADAPLSTVTSRGTQQQPVTITLIDRDAIAPEYLERAEMTAAFLVKYYGTQNGAHELIKPLDTVTSRDRFAVVTVTIDTQTFVLVDIGMRMLTPRELANAQGFPADYVIAPECWYMTDGGNRKFGRLPKSHQISKIGNAVCPQMSEALVRANLCTRNEEKAAA